MIGEEEKEDLEEPTGEPDVEKDQVAEGEATKEDRAEGIEDEARADKKRMADKMDRIAKHLREQG